MCIRDRLEPMKKHSGRNNTGRITVRHQGGGNRTKYRVIDFKRQKTDVPATVTTLEYDPNRSAFIALVEYKMCIRDSPYRGQDHQSACGRDPGSHVLPAGPRRDHPAR